jgi:hypothetical protein
MVDRYSPHFVELIPELPSWNNGKGIDPKGWIECVGNYELATGYSLVFWPNFVRFEGYVLREGFSEESLRSFERTEYSDRMSVEAVMNHVHIVDIHRSVEPTEAQLRYLGRVLKDIYEAKLGRDFPELRIIVSFHDEAGLDLDDYQLTFWQATD